MYKKRIALILVLITTGLGFYFTYLFYRVFSSNTAFNNPTSYVFVSTGTDIQGLLQELEPLLISTDDFRLVAEKKGYSTRIRAGKYAIEKGMNNNEIINTLRARSLPVKVTFNNVERIEDLAGRLAQQVEADSLTLLKQMLDPEFLAVNGFTPETALGMYIPNTYQFYWNVSPKALQKRLYKQYEYFWTPRRRNSVYKRGLTLDEAMILASIVQKESQKADEQPLIAQVYINRLNKGMRLQADPTVVFAEKAQNDFSMVIRRVLIKDLKINSSYNTYKIKGFPRANLHA